MDCAVKFEKEVAAIPGVTRAELNFGASKITVEGIYDPAAISRIGSRHSITALTGDQQGTVNVPVWKKHNKMLTCCLSGVAVLTGWILMTAGASHDVVVTMYLIAMITGGFALAKKGFFSICRADFDINVLMTIAVVGAVLIGQWSEGAVVAFLFSVSESLESYTMDKARRSIKELMNIAPREATVRRKCGQTLLPVDQILVGDILIIKPGEKIAMDGKIINGSTSVNQAAITGESLPVEKETGNEVFAGTINEEGAIEVVVTKLVNDTTIARIIHMVEDAQAQKAPSQKFIDRFAAVYTPVVIALAATVMLVPPMAFGLPWGPWIYRGLTLLVVSCPCALVISTPVALVTAIGNAARNGVLIKGGVYLEEAGKLSVMAFDKTGTLTLGKPVVTDVIPLGITAENQVLSLAAGIELFSEHPLAKAIVKKAEDEKVSPTEVENFSALKGKGATAILGERQYFIGSPRLFAELKADTAETAKIVAGLQLEGKTAMMLGTAAEVLGIIAVADKVRDSSKTALTGLKQAGLQKAVMLTGDNQSTANAIAAELQLDDVYAELLPEHKVEAVKNLLAKYGKAAMVGDGINDAPALASATVGIAMGVAGTDTALETADVALMADDLTKLPFLLHLSRAALKIIRQNVYFAIIIKLLAILIMFPGWLTLWMAIMADMGASVLVTLNGIRLMRIKP